MRENVYCFIILFFLGGGLIVHQITILSILQMPNAWKECRENIHNAVDNLVRELKNETETSGTFTTGTENKDCHFESFQMFLQNMRHKESGRVVILIDDNMYYSSMRYKYYQLTRKCKLLPGHHFTKRSYNFYPYI